MSKAFSFEALLQALAGEVVGAPVLTRDRRWSGLAHDSRCVRPGDLFVAVPGGQHDGHDHIAAALAAGAVGVVAERPVEINVPLVRVSNARRALGRAARLRYGAPSAALRSFAVTGTNGKTTVAWILRHLLRSLGQPTAMFGTVEYDTGAKLHRARLTTPDALQLQKLLNEAREHGCQNVVFEASSHGIALDRLEACDVHVAIYTNLTRDHLDYHHDLDEYRETKLQLIEIVRAAQGDWPKGIAYNAADPAWQTIPERGAAMGLVPFRLGLPSDTSEWSAEPLRESLEGTEFLLRGPVLPDGGLTGRTALPGRINLENCLAALAGAVAARIDIGEALASLETLSPPPGRLELVPGGPLAATVLVDFAHTPDAVRCVLEDLRPLTPGRLIAVFGCGGDRDRGKRPLMGKAATDVADLAVLTSDNPRSENPQRIVEDVLEGVRGNCEVILDRRQAIARAIESADPADVVVVLGKGHEDTQIVGDERRHFDDRQVAGEILLAMKSRDDAHGRVADERSRDATPSSDP